MLSDYVSALPASVIKLGIIYNRLKLNESTEFPGESLGQALSAIPGHINELTLSECLLNCEVEVSYKLPATLTTFNVIPDVGKKSLFTKDVKLAAHPNITTIRFKGVRITYQELKEILPDSLQEFDLESNLNGYRYKTLQAIFNELPPNLKILKLGNTYDRSNGLNQVDLIRALTKAPASLTELDISNNGFLYLAPDEFAEVMNHLPNNISKLRCVETSGNTLTGREVAERFSRIPSHIVELDLSGCNLLGLSIDKFIIALKGIPRHVKTIDLSDNSIYRLRIADVKRLFSQLPFQVRTVRLNRNKLDLLEASQISEAFSQVNLTNLSTLDIRDNGLDTLPQTKLNQLMDAFPDVTLLIEPSKIFVRNDGVLTRYSSGPGYGFFNPQGQLKHQRQLASSVTQAFKGLTVVSPFVDPSQAAEHAQLTDSFISPIPPATITEEHRLRCEAAVRRRISVCSASEATVNLAGCGLNQIDSEKRLGAIFKGIPEAATSLNLRGNGFLHNPESSQALFGALRGLPKNIAYIDLSGNGFERASSEILKQLFASLPETVTHISISQEKPVSPAQYIAKHHWPSWFPTYVANETDLMKQARKMLDDYTKGDSPFWRFLTFHWVREHVAEVAKIVRAMDDGIITNMDDLMGELEAINLDNEIGSLAQRIAFLYKLSQEQTPVSQAEAQDTAGVQTLTHSV
ncbi:DUF5617 domain-containing protein [Legionella yabuuchiae]|uniref:DUF5617 domain-containing protein n=1 Tax=Legionella yabuuchiae TaxID=376727 RepID=UPI0010568936|nr:DUF5617 domain-containing protein [Legionella yabuuchiae]